MLLEKPRVAHLVTTFRIFCTKRRFIIIFTTARHCSLSWIKIIQFTPPHSVFLRTSLILSSYITPGLQIISSTHIFWSKSNSIFLLNYLETLTEMHWNSSHETTHAQYGEVWSEIPNRCSWSCVQKHWWNYVDNLMSRLNSTQITRMKQSSTWFYLLTSRNQSSPVYNPVNSW